MSLVVMVVAVMVIVCGHHGLWPSLSNPSLRLFLACFVTVVAISKQVGGCLLCIVCDIGTSSRRCVLASASECDV